MKMSWSCLILMERTIRYHREMLVRNISGQRFFRLFTKFNNSNNNPLRLSSSFNTKFFSSSLFVSPTTTTSTTSSLTSYHTHPTTTRSYSNTTTITMGDDQVLLKSTPDLCDEYEDTIRIIDPSIGFSNYGSISRFAGTVVTVKCYEDNSKVKELSKEIGIGKVLVVDGGGSRRRALLGDQVALQLLESKWEGIVIYGSIRDVDEIQQLSIPIKIDDDEKENKNEEIITTTTIITNQRRYLGVQALGTCPIKTTKRNEGQIQIPITFAGVTINPGDFIACDNNGIVVNSEPMNMKG